MALVTTLSGQETATNIAEAAVNCGTDARFAPMLRIILTVLAIWIASNLLFVLLVIPP